jgi:hypothetical protein
MGGSVHFGLLDHEEFILCSCCVRVNTDCSHIPLEWLTPGATGARPQARFRGA